MDEYITNDSILRSQLWEHGWEDHRRRQMERLAALPLPEKLLWLEEAHRLVLHLQSGQRPQERRFEG